MSSIRYLNFKFLQSKIIYKNKFIDQIVNNIYLINIKFDVCVKNIKNCDFQLLEFQNESEFDKDRV